MLVTNKVLLNKRHVIRYYASIMMEKEEKKNLEHKESKTTLIPVIQEHVTIGKEVIDTAKVYIKKRVTEEEQTLNIPLIHEGYTVEHVSINKIVETPPSVRQEGDIVIIPVVREVVVVEKKFELVEEIHMIKTKTSIPHIQDITLIKEHVEVERVPIQTDTKD
jgi:uncharacterized protein (TIGR02271 family)